MYIRPNSQHSSVSRWLNEIDTVTISVAFQNMFGNFCIKFKKYILFLYFKTLYFEKKCVKL